MTLAPTETIKEVPILASTGKAALAPRAWRLPAVDGMRAMACMMVFGIHTWEIARKPAMPVHLFGHTLDLARLVESFPAGVDLFMVLSGFCLFWPLCKSEDALQKWSWPEYVWRRAKRICPPYYVAIAYVILLPQVFVLMTRLAGIQFEGHPAKWQPNPSAQDILYHMTFIHTLSFEHWDGITGAFWSLGLEMQFYLVFPLVVYRYRKHRLATILAMIAASILFRVAINSLYVGYYHLDQPQVQDVERLCNISFIGRWMQFASGMLCALAVAHYYRNHKMMSGLAGTSLIVLAIAIYTLVVTGCVDEGNLFLNIFPTRDLLMGLQFSIVVFAVTSSRTWLRHLFELKPVIFIGTISYSIFLIHQTTAWFFSELVRKKIYHDPEIPATGSLTHWFLLITVGLVVVILASYPYYLMFEKPFIAGPKKKPAPAPIPAAATPATN